MTNKDALISLASQKAGFTKKDIKEALDAIIDVIMDQTAKGESVNLPGFGKFETVEKAAREGRNPATGEPMTIAARKAVKFKPAGAYKNFINA